LIEKLALLVCLKRSDYGKRNWLSGLFTPKGFHNILANLRGTGVDNFADTIRSIAFFSGLSREDLARVAGKLEEQQYPAGQDIVKQGDEGDALYVVQSGAVEVTLENGTARPESLAMLGAGDCFGEMALFTGQKRSATVRAFVDSAILKLSQENWDELLRKYPSLALHFCKVLSSRLAEADKHVSQGRGAFTLVMEEFFAAQTAEMQSFLTRTAEMKILDADAIHSVLSVADPQSFLAALATSYPTFLQTNQQGQYEYRQHLRDFLVGKLKQTVPEEHRKRLHCDFAAYFSRQGQWLLAIDHFSKAEEWQAALKLLESYGETLLDSEAPQTLLAVLDALPATMADPHGYLARLRGQVNARLGNLEGAIDSYRAFLGHKQLAAGETIDVAQYYQELAELYRRNGELGEALGCLQMGATLVEGGNGDFDAVEALRSVENLQQRRGAGQEAVSWGSRALRVAEKLRTAKAKRLFGFNKKAIGLTLATIIATVVWYLPPQAPLDEKGVQFLAIFLGIVVLWAFEIFEEHVVAILLLLSWLLLKIVPIKIALTGFSESSWFFALGVLGIGAAVTSSGLLYRVALQVLRVLPPKHKLYSSSLLISGLFITPVFPENKGRIGIMAPLTQTISEALGYGVRSNGSAGLAFSSLIGFTQLTFTFLTGATYCLVGWSVLPTDARAGFGWLTWFEAALPAAMVTLLLFYFAIQFCFPTDDEKNRHHSSNTLLTQMEILGPLTSGEWISIGVVSLAAFGWLGKPLHGISEAWVALSALALFLVTGLLDKKGLRNNIDWGYLLFLGVVSAMDDVMRLLGVDRWLSGFVAPVLSTVSFSPLLFLFVVALMVYAMRFMLKKPATVVLFLVTLTPMAQQAGMHPGVLLLTILIAIEAWFLPYQTDSYQIAYYSTDQKAFSHAQGRKLMIVKFFVSFLSIAVSVPYWRMLGFIR